MAWRQHAAFLAGAPVAALARLRQGCYRMLSQSLLYPQEERLQGLVTAVGDVARRGRRGRLASHYPGMTELLQAVQTLTSQEAAALQSQYTRVFLSDQVGCKCPLHESAYAGEDPLDQGGLLSQLAKEYAQAGVAPLPYVGESGDHVAVELGFMVYLCSMEAEAWEQEDLASGMQTLQQESSFLERHLIGYLAEVERNVERAISWGRYRRVIETAAAFVAHDQDLLKEMVLRFQPYLQDRDGALGHRRRRL
ncbi:MAG: molecular chaperone TorD family protein [Chloroflexi bacterium]|nr:molecular chaperone TorD family protein [Chloroflexota bacterium]